MAGEVGCDPRVKEWERCANAIGEVVSDQLAYLGVAGEESHECTAENTGDEQRNDVQAALVESAGEIGPR